MEQHIFTVKSTRGKKLTKDELDQAKDYLKQINKMTIEEHCRESNTLFGKRESD